MALLNTLFKVCYSYFKRLVGIKPSISCFYFLLISSVSLISKFYSFSKAKLYNAIKSPHPPMKGNMVFKLYLGNFCTLWMFGDIFF